MLLDLIRLRSKYDLDIRGVYHIGAHFGQENTVYTEMGIVNRVFFEPLPVTYKKLLANVGSGGGVTCVNTSLGNRIGVIDMFVETANQGQSSSILEPDIHIKQYPHITFNEKVTVNITTLDKYLLGSDINGGDYNFINIDVQGYELEVFKGAESTLEHIDYVMTEVNRENVYKGCPMVSELDGYLSSYGFSRVETTWDGGTWGDALYVKR